MTISALLGVLANYRVVGEISQCIRIAIPTSRRERDHVFNGAGNEGGTQSPIAHVPFGPRGSTVSGRHLKRVISCVDDSSINGEAYRSAPVERQRPLSICCTLRS